MTEEIDAANVVHLPTYDNCYVCGQDHPRGLRMRFFVGDEGQVHAWFRPDDTQTGYQDIVHGGVTSAVLDEILGWPIALQAGQMCFTGELTIRFVKPMSAGRTYLATAYPGTDKGRYWEGKGNVRDDQGTIYAKANGKYFLLPAEQSAGVAAMLTYRPDDLPIFRDNHREGNGA